MHTGPVAQPTRRLICVPAYEWNWKRPVLPISRYFLHSNINPATRRSPARFALATTVHDYAVDGGTNISATDACRFELGIVDHESQNLGWFFTRGPADSGRQIADQARATLTYYYQQTMA